MQVENLRDILHWTEVYHRRLSDYLQECADKQSSERVKLLLEYLSEHEGHLSELFEAFEAQSELKTLNTWCYEYLDKNPIQLAGEEDIPLNEASTQEVMRTIAAQHDQVTGLYRYLLARANIPSNIELLERLLALEEHEVMRMMHGANRWEDS
ncbi:hypothetical protein HMF8227_01830 [Saliniradius amylolyticus]|uniref:ATPase n=1 Tax=Saliniradius amylolyticus TaxID=2183582 RepID=A0A2S2E3U1_9ALTE|nr:ATPase [Saliniradius amylolyticus]AWL12303.1 hypothetical protein HMF8227_01830 [Saliniradius amylolyticus]